MALVKTISPEEAEGKIKEAYSAFLKTAGVVPKPFEMMSASPDLMFLQGDIINYFMKHPTLGLPLLTHIRLMAAVAYDYAYCIAFNSNILKMVGADDQQIEAVKSDPEQATLDDKDKAMLLFVVKALKTPEAIEQPDVDALRALGWTDKDIFDALAHGAGMLGPSVMFKALKMA
jgi:alkylhydroperoxidase family enzyme